MTALLTVQPLNGAIARQLPLAMGLAIALSVSLASTQLFGALPSSMEGAAEGPSTSCVGCHTTEVPEGAPTEAPGGTAMQRQAECRR